MKILFVLEHYYPYIGGAEQLFQSLAESLVDRKHQLTVITTRFDDKLPRKEIINGVNIIRINCRNRFLFSFLSLPRLFKEIRHFDIIHTTTYTAALPTWIASAFFRKKCLITFHEYWGKLWFELPFISFIEKNIFYLFERIIFKLPFHKTIAVSEYTKKALIENGKNANQVIQIYNGLNHDFFSGYFHRKPEQFTATYFGRLGVSKGLDLLIPAINEHLANYPDAIFNLIIPRIPEKMYQQVITLIGNRKNNIYLYHNLSKEELCRMISQSTCVVIPSYSEGFCFAAVETISIGTPIIHSNQGALKETVSGKQIKMKDMSVSSLINVLEKAHKNKWEITDVRYFPLQDSVDAYLKLYAELMNKS